MKYCEKCLAKNGNFYFFLMALQTSCGDFRQRERVTLQTACGAERVSMYYFSKTCITEAAKTKHTYNAKALYF